MNKEEQMEEPLGWAEAMMAEGIDTGMSTPDGAVKEPQLDTDDTGRFRFIWKADRLRMVVENLSRGRDSLNALVSATYIPKQGKPQLLLSKKTINFRSKSGGEQLYRMLNRRRSAAWEVRIEQVAQMVDDYFAIGDPMVWLDDVVTPNKEQYLLYPLILKGHHTVAFGEGSATKSLLMIAAALSCAGCEVLPGMKPDATPSKALYLDWEATSGDHKRRYSKLKAANVNGVAVNSIAHKRMTASMNESIEEIQALVIKFDLRLILVDSVGMAVGGMISDESAVLEFFNACRKIRTKDGDPMTFVSIAHIRKSDSNKNKKPIGSQYWFTQPRSVWEITKEQDEGASVLTTTIWHKKVNEGMLQKPMTWEVSFMDDRTLYKKIDPASVLSNADKLSAADQMAAFLKDHPDSSTQDILAGTGLAPAAAKKLSSNKMFVHNDGSPALWNLSPVTGGVNPGDIEGEGEVVTSSPFKGGGGDNPLQPNPHSSKEEEDNLTVLEPKPWWVD